MVCANHFIGFSKGLVCKLTVCSSSSRCVAWVCPYGDLPVYGCGIGRTNSTVFGVPPNDTTYFSPVVTAYLPGSEYFLSLSSCAKAASRSASASASQKSASLLASGNIILYFFSLALTVWQI